jgi:UDP-N-acetylglucosamine acyltransferase
MPGQSIHPTAIITGDVQLSDGVTIGPYCVLEGKISIGANTAVLPHTLIKGTTLIGAHCRVGPHATIGYDPQHLKFDGRETYLVIEDHVTVREFASLHRATHEGIEHATRVGSHCLLMACSHVAHDCKLSNHVTMANAVLLGGHVTVGERAVIGGGTVIHQFCRVGRIAMIAGGEAMSKDVLPFSAVFHNRHKGYNAIGCRRAGMDAPTIHAVRRAFHAIHAHHSPAQAARDLLASGAASNPIVKELIDFIQASTRGVQPAGRRSVPGDAME